MKIGLHNLTGDVIDSNSLLHVGAPNRSSSTQALLARRRQFSHQLVVVVLVLAGRSRLDPSASASMVPTARKQMGSSTRGLVGHR